MSSFTPRLLLASALIAVPATVLTGAPASADVPAVPEAVPEAVPMAIKTVELAKLRTAKSGTDVKRYQIYLRRYAKKVGINYRKINRSGATGYYGTETRNLTQTTTKHFASKDTSWVPRSKSNASKHPNSKFVKLIGLKAIKAPVVTVESSGSATGYVANPAWPAIKNAGTGTKPSTWQGPALKHPRTGKVFSYNVSRWANLVRAIMREHGVADKYLVGILAQIQQESSGDPDAVNNWDSNARKGTPSKGLLQVILPTYQAYAKKGYTASKYQTVPYTNIWAALNYVKGRYGMGKFQSWNSGQNQGY